MDAVQSTLVNTNLDAEVETMSQVRGRRPGSTSRSAAWSLVGPTAWATNLGPKRQVRIVHTPVRNDKDGWRVTLPRYPLTAVEIRP